MEIGKLGSILTDNQTNQAVQSATQSSDETFAKKLEAAAQKQDDKELRQVCKEFESIMLSMLYKQMKATVIKSDLIEKDPGTEIFESMQDEKLMEQAAKTGSLGLAESLYKQLARQAGRSAALNGNAAALDKKKESNSEGEPEVEEIGE